VVLNFLHTNNQFSCCISIEKLNFWLWSWKVLCCQSLLNSNFFSPITWFSLATLMNASINATCPQYFPWWSLGIASFTYLWGFFLELLQLDVVCVHTTMGFMADKPSPSWLEPPSSKSRTSFSFLGESSHCSNTKLLATCVSVCA
jgi:hypothetical protein